MYRLKKIFILYVTGILLLTGSDAIFMSRRQRDEGHCNTETRNLDIVREISLEYQGSVITVNCVKTIVAKECEGACLSKVSPSVHHFPDFEKVHVSYM